MSTNFFLVIYIIVIGTTYYYLWVRFIRPAKINRIRFKFFELRDRLALLAMKDIIDQNGVQYKTVIALLNQSINTLSDLSIMDIVRAMILSATDSKTRETVNEIISNLEHDNSEYKEIVREFFKFNIDILKDYINLLDWFVRLMSLIVRFKIIINTYSKLSNKWNKIYVARDYYQANYERLCNV